MNFNAEQAIKIFVPAFANHQQWCGGPMTIAVGTTPVKWQACYVSQRPDAGIYMYNGVIV